MSFYVTVLLHIAITENSDILSYTVSGYSICVHDFKLKYLVSVYTCYCHWVELLMQSCCMLL